MRCPPIRSAKSQWISSKLYKVERDLPSLRGLVGAERERALQARREARKKESEPLMQALKAWALEQSALPGSLLDKALSYMLNLWPGFMRFVNILVCPRQQPVE